MVSRDRAGIYCCQIGICQAFYLSVSQSGGGGHMQMTKAVFRVLLHTLVRDEEGVVATYICPH